MKRELVLGFDSWVGGAHNFERLVPAFNDKGLELRLLHIGSWGADSGRASHEKIGDLSVFDISYYKGLDLFSILEIEKPKAVLFLSNDVFAHRSINRYCKKLKIPTIHLYHGLVGVQSIELNELYKVNIFQQFLYVMERVPKAVKYIWPLYLKALVKTKASIDEWRRFLSDICRMAMGKYISVAAKDSKTSCCCIYTKSDVIHAQQKYGYLETEIVIVGNPDLAKFKLTENNIAAGLLKYDQCQREVVYVDTGLIYAGMVFNSQVDFLEHLLILKSNLYELGYSLCVKLHPDHFRTDFPNLAKQKGITLVDGDEFIERLLHSSAVIVEPSTVAMIPALMGLPLLLAGFGKLKGQKYGKVLMDYPRSLLLDDLNNMKQFLDKSKEFSRETVLSWIANNSGPLPAEEMPKRVADAVLNVMNKQ